MRNLQLRILFGVVETVLIVEDDIDLRRMFRSALSLAGYRVLEAGDGLHALRLLDSHHPDLVVLDLGLPLISGLVVREELAAHAHTRDIPVVIVTGSISAAHEKLDVACVLRKPVSPDELVATVKSCMASGSSFGGA
jgi:DNA-binding response OmpR family regulator